MQLKYVYATISGSTLLACYGQLKWYPNWPRSFANLGVCTQSFTKVHVLRVPTRYYSSGRLTVLLSAFFVNL